MAEIRRVILASSSAYRRELLVRLRIPFETARPELDESALPGERPEATARRLAVAKARAIAIRYPGSLIIGSDQVACVGDRVFGKPGTHDAAIDQLQILRGQTAVFHTALCLLDASSERTRVRSIPTEVRFRMLSDAEILRYLEREQPYDCAGSAKSEGLGISLLEYIRGDDPNALIGLPLIALCEMLRAEGIELP